MKTTAKERGQVMHRLAQLGIAYHQAENLRRVAMQLHSWFERECGDENGCIGRDETTNKPYWLNAFTGKRHRIPDREAGANRRLAALMSELPELTAYVQTDPRGACLYILHKGDFTPEEPLESVYTRGVAVY